MSAGIFTMWVYTITKAQILKQLCLNSSKFLRYKFEASSSQTHMSLSIVPKQSKILEQIYNTKINLVSKCCFLFIHMIKSRYK